MSRYQSFYIYAIVDGHFKQTFSDLGIGDATQVFPIKFKDVTAIVSKTPFAEYDPTEDNTLAHEHVIQALLKHDVTVAPMRFCTIVRSENDLQKLLHSGYMSFKRNLVKVKHRHEFDVKVFLYIERLQQELSDSRKLLTESQLIAGAFYDLLKSVADDAVLSDQVTAEMILNASFLVRKDQREAFREAVVNFDKQYTDSLKIRISGPTAPYNFVSMPTK